MERGDYREAQPPSARSRDQQLKFPAHGHSERGLRGRPAHPAHGEYDHDRNRHDYDRSGHVHCARIQPYRDESPHGASQHARYTGNDSNGRYPDDHRQRYNSGDGHRGDRSYYVDDGDNNYYPGDSACAPAAGSVSVYWPHPPANANTSGSRELSRTFATDDDEEIIALMNQHVRGLSKPSNAVNVAASGGNNTGQCHGSDGGDHGAPVPGRRGSRAAGATGATTEPEVSVSLLSRLRTQMAQKRAVDAEADAAPQTKPHVANAATVVSAVYEEQDDDDMSEPEPSRAPVAHMRANSGVSSDSNGVANYRGIPLVMPRRTQ